MYNTTTQTVAANANVVLSTIGEQSGMSIKENNGTILLVKPGLYYVTADVTITGAASIAIAKDGTAIPGVAAIAKPTETGDVNTISTSALVPVRYGCMCPCAATKITFNNVGADSASVSNINVNVYKLA